MTDVYHVIIYLLLFAFVILTHELGHMIGYLFFKRKSKLVMHWYGVLYVVTDKIHLMKLKEHLIVGCFGVLFGYLALLPFASDTYYNNMIIIYTLMCCIDITNMITLLENRKYKDMTLIDFTRNQIKEWENE